MTALLILFLLSLTAFGWIIESLNLSQLSSEVPAPMREFYDPERYRKSQDYLQANTRFTRWRILIHSLLLCGFIVASGFGVVNSLSRNFAVRHGLGSIGQGLAYAGLLAAATWIAQLPFQVHHTFRIEERFGFNRTTPKTFALDQLKAVLLGGGLGGATFAGLLWFFRFAGARAWLWAWLALTAFQLFLLLIAPVVILPLFNRFIPLPPGELKSQIEEFARREKFRLQGIFTMDGSKRSTKANAFFTGFGRFRRIVLFDTLIERHPVDELVAILAHEIGHYKRKHIPKQVVLSIVVTGSMLYLLSLFLDSPTVSEVVTQAFRGGEPSIAASMIFFGILYSPISRLLSLYGLYLSRKYEFEADAYSAKSYGKPEALAQGLKRLSAESLSNLRPHRLKVLVDYTHPPTLERIGKLESL